MFAICLFFIEIIYVHMHYCYNDNFCNLSWCFSFHLGFWEPVMHGEVLLFYQSPQSKYPSSNGILCDLIMHSFPQFRNHEWGCLMQKYILTCNVCCFQFLIASAHILKHPLFQRACQLAFHKCDFNAKGYFLEQEVFIHTISTQ